MRQRGDIYSISFLSIGVRFYLWSAVGVVEKPVQKSVDLEIWQITKEFRKDYRKSYGAKRRTYGNLPKPAGTKL